MKIKINGELRDVSSITLVGEKNFSKLPSCEMIIACSDGEFIHVSNFEKVKMHLSERKMEITLTEEEANG